jgi:hypothetical protein
MLHSLDAKVHTLASTVRLGGKWSDLEYGENIELCVCTRDPETHDVQGIGEVVVIWFGRFCDIPARLLQYEHEERSRQYGGLKESMENAYGDKFLPDRPVVVIVYLRQT